MNRNAVLRTKHLSRAVLLAAGLAGALGGCGPRAAIPTRPRALPLPASLPGLLEPRISIGRLDLAGHHLERLALDGTFRFTR